MKRQPALQTGRPCTVVTAAAAGSAAPVHGFPSLVKGRHVPLAAQRHERAPARVCRHCQGAICSGSGRAYSPNRIALAQRHQWQGCWRQLHWGQLHRRQPHSRWQQDWRPKEAACHAGGDGFSGSGMAAAFWNIVGSGGIGGTVSAVVRRPSIAGCMREEAQERCFSKGMRDGFSAAARTVNGGVEDPDGSAHTCMFRFVALASRHVQLHHFFPMFCFQNKTCLSALRLHSAVVTCESVGHLQTRKQQALTASSLATLVLCATTCSSAKPTWGNWIAGYGHSWTTLPEALKHPELLPLIERLPSRSASCCDDACILLDTCGCERWACAATTAFACWTKFQATSDTVPETSAADTTSATPPDACSPLTATGGRCARCTAQPVCGDGGSP